ncbi:AMP-binding protein [Porticoccaceae bacterium]|nr:AMP-binding protein [Porticoccaceae bacterium]
MTSITDTLFTQPDIHTGNASIELVDIDTCLRRSAQQHPAQLALADSRQQLTWAQLDQQLNRVANALIGLGIQPNERIAILGRNSVDYALLFLGGLRAGICIVPLSTLASSEALAGMVNDSEAKLLFVSRGYWGLIEPVTDKLSTLIPGGLKVLESEGLDIDDNDLQSFSSFIEGASSAPLISLSRSIGALI